MRAEVKLSEVGQIDEARELLKITASYQDVEYKLAGHADEVKNGQITRAAEQKKMTAWREQSFWSKVGSLLAWLYL